MNLKRTLIILFILGVGLNSYAQLEEEDQTTIFIPIRVAKQIQKDLIGKDSCESMLNIAHEEIVLLYQNIEFKDKFIDTLTNQGLRIREMYENEKNMKLTYKAVAEECKNEYDLLKKQHSTYKKFTKLVGFLGTAVVAGLTAVILFVK